MENSNLTVNTIRLLSADAIEKSNSGHPGICLGAAPIAYSLWQNFLTFNPSSSKKFFNRDRFILSAAPRFRVNNASQQKILANAITCVIYPFSHK